MKRKLEFGVGIPTGTEGLMYPIPFVEDIRDNIRIAEKAQALVYSFYPGPWGGQALAEVLLGEVNPPRTRVWDLWFKTLVRRISAAPFCGAHFLGGASAAGSVF